MTRKASVKETGEDIPNEKWERFEDAVGVDRSRRDKDRVQTDQPFRSEQAQPTDHDADAKTTKRTE